MTTFEEFWNSPEIIEIRKEKAKYWQNKFNILIKNKHENQNNKNILSSNKIQSCGSKNRKKELVQQKSQCYNNF